MDSYFSQGFLPVRKSNEPDQNSNTPTSHSEPLSITPPALPCQHESRLNIFATNSTHQTQPCTEI